jgi:hypothetical protein
MTVGVTWAIRKGDKIVGIITSDIKENSRFRMGQLVFTRGVNDKVAEDADFSKFVVASLARHNSGDWGDVGNEDGQMNDMALIDDSRILSAYEKEGLPKIWIITEADRSVTTILFPDEY